MTEVRFLTSGANSVLGGFSAGDTARVSPAFAKHLVEEARVAEFVTAPKAAGDDVAAAKPKKARKEKSE